MTPEQSTAILALCDEIEAADAAATPKANEIYMIQSKGGDYRFMSLYNGTFGLWDRKRKGAIEDGEKHARIIQRMFPRSAIPELARLVREALNE